VLTHRGRYRAVQCRPLHPFYLPAPRGACGSLCESAKAISEAGVRSVVERRCHGTCCACVVCRLGPGLGLAKNIRPLKLPPGGRGGHDRPLQSRVLEPNEINRLQTTNSENLALQAGPRPGRYDHTPRPTPASTGFLLIETIAPRASGRHRTTSSADKASQKGPISSRWFRDCPAVPAQPKRQHPRSWPRSRPSA
jgi:hypothetical protein